MATLWFEDFKGGDSEVYLIRVEAHFTFFFGLDLVAEGYEFGFECDLFLFLPLDFGLLDGFWAFSGEALNRAFHPGAHPECKSYHA